MLKALFGPRFERRLALERPKKKRPHKRLLDLKRNLLFLEAGVDFPAFLPRRYDLGQHLAAFGCQLVSHETAHALARKKGREERAGQVGTAPRFLCGAT